MENVLKTVELTKSFGRRPAVKNVNITVPKGEIYGLVGRNGAGKTTIMRMVTGLVKPDSGSITLFDSDRLEFQRRRIGCIIDHPAVYLNMTAAQNLEVFRLVCGVPEKDAVDRLLQLVGLADTGSKTARNFSMGMRQRLGIAIALMGNPDFLVLDEPINWLDPEGIREMRDLLLKLNREQSITMLISSHILGELSKIATRYGFICDGEMRSEMSADELHAKCRRCLKIKVDDVKTGVSVLERVLGTSNYDILEDNVIRLFDFVNEPSKVNTELVRGGVGIISLSEAGDDLEGFYFQQMGGTVDE